MVTQRNTLIDILNLESRADMIESIKESGSAATDLKIDNETGLYAFFADPAEHSLSPKMYNTAFKELGMNRFYFASRVPEGMIRQAILKMRLMGLNGANISMPHKQAVMDELDEVDNLALLCEAVNTVVCINGDAILKIANNSNAIDQSTSEPSSNKSYSQILPILKGYNTDVVGAVTAIKEMGCDIKGNSAAVLGMGGAGKAVITGLADAGASEISVFVRKARPKEHSRFASKIANAFPGVKVNVLSLRSGLRAKLEAANLLVNCTNVGMGDMEGKSLIPDITYLHSNLYVMDVIYAPEKTKLLEQAEAAGCKGFVNGLPMLLHQGEAAFKLYTGLDRELVIQLD